MNDASHVDQSIPESVGPYRIVDRIGAGGMGVVYRARDERLERWVAIKHIRPGEADLRSRERLRREARTVAGLSHPSIVQVHDIVESDGGDWIVMELVEGQTLKGLLREDRLEMQQIVLLAREIAEGLAEAHSKGIVHRDLKTENVKVTALGHAKILDFGLAKVVLEGRKEDSLSVQGAILGTGRAMSPEQALGEEVSHLSDLFSFGSLLFEMVTGRPPFVGSSLILTMAQICTEEQPSARDLNPSVPREFSELIDHLLQKDPLQRPQSAGEVVDALKGIAARLASRTISKASEDPSDTAVAPAVPQSPPVLGRPVTAGRLMPAVGRVASRGSEVRPVAMARHSESTAGIFIKTLVQTELVGDLVGDRFGDADAYERYSRHDRVIRDVLAEHDGLEIERSESGFLFLFERPVDAVEFVLAYHLHLITLGEDLGLRLEARAAIHLSEIFLRENTPHEIHRGAKPFEVEGLAKLVVSRVLGLAEAGQTILTQEAYDLTRRALVGHSLADRKLYWGAHGRFLLRGVDESIRVFEVAAEPIPTTRSPMESENAQRIEDQAIDSPARPSRRKKLYGWSAALVPLALISALGWIFWPGEALRPERDRPPASPGGVDRFSSHKAAQRPTLAVLGFRNLAEGSKEKWLATALAELLTTDLGAGEDLRLIASESVDRMKRMQQGLLTTETLAPDTLNRIRAELGADFVILGSYLSLGEDKKLTVQMKLQDTRQGEMIVTESVAGNESELPDLVARIGETVRQKLDLEAIPGDRATAVRASTSANLEANRRFYQGLEGLRRFDIVAARDDFLEAVRLDPGFALAYAALSRAWLILGYDAEAAENGHRAFELAKNLPREQYLEIEGIYYRATGDLSSAITTHKALWRFFPDNVEYGLRLADLQIVAGKSHEALVTVAELRQLASPNDEDPRIDLVESQAAIEIGSYDRALVAAERILEKSGTRGSPTLEAESQLARGRSLFQMGRLKEAALALGEARHLFDEAGDELGLGLTLSVFAFLEEGKRNLSRAEELLREALKIFEATGSRKRILETKNGLAYMIQGKGELKAARQLLEEALQIARDLRLPGNEAITLDTLSFVLYQLGELARAERMAREVVVISQEQNDRRTEAWVHVNLGLILLSAGKLSQAKSLFEKLLTMADEAEDKHMTALALSGLGAIFYAEDDLARAEQLFLRYQEMQRVGRDWGEQAITEPLHAATLLELRRPTEAYEVALDVAGRFESSERPIYEVTALQIAAEALFSEGRREVAERVLARAVAQARTTESPEVRLRAEVAEIRFLETGKPQQALRRLRGLIGEATRLNLKPVELEALLVLGQKEMALGTAESFELGRARLEALAEEASRQGFNLLARRARESLLELEATNA